MSANSSSVPSPVPSPVYSLVTSPVPSLVSSRAPSPAPTSSADREQEQHPHSVCRLSDFSRFRCTQPEATAATAVPAELRCERVEVEVVTGS